jgi:large subunit ribosomal protein L29
MKIKELRDMSVEELARQAGEFRQEILNLKVQQASGQLENPARLRTARRSIARIETLLTQRRATATA